MLNILIIDDEPLAQQVLVDYCAKLDQIAVCGCFFDAVSALQYLRQYPVDALLLDIQMPDLTGLDLLDMLHDDGPKVVLTTGFTDYALQGFNYDNVVDYLHKPIKFSRFVKSMERLQRQIQLEHDFLAKSVTPTAGQTELLPDYLLINDGKTMHRVATSEILYVQSWGNYLKIFLENDTMLLARKTISEMQQTLPASRFERIHKSFLVNISKVKNMEINQLRIADQNLPIGKSYLMSVRHRFENLTTK